MNNGEARWGLLQAEYLLEYDRRKIQDCVDIFRNLAAVFWQMDMKEKFEEKTREDGVVDFDENSIERDDRERLLLEENARENRKSLAEQMRQLANLMQDVAGTSVQMVRLGSRQEKQIERALAGEGLEISDICLLRGKEGHLEISATVSTRKEQSATVADVAGYLSVLLDLRLAAQKRNPYFVGAEPVILYFEEEPFWGFMTGAATAIKEGERISGDSFSFWEQDGQAGIILSDGVGSGEDAAADSGQIVELAEQILDAGLSCGMTGQLLNSLMRVQTREEHMPTLDLCSVNLRNGEARFVKAGGICSFIRRGDYVERIEENTLPLGLEKEEGIFECIRQLDHGDMVVLLSDGIFQDWPGEDCFADIQEQISQISSQSPQDLANRLLRYAIAQCKGKIHDDMTVLVLGIWENSESQDTYSPKM